VRFLIDADLPRSIKRLLEDHGHEATDVRDIGLGGAPDAEIASYAQRSGCCLVTGDFGFADLRNYPPGDYAGLVVLSPPRGASAARILELMAVVLQRPDLERQLSGRLAIVEPGRIRLRSG
jgi:hypothetical protein